MKKTASTALLAFALLCLLATRTQNITLVEANMMPFFPQVPPPLPPTISVASPENRTYHENEVELRFHAKVSLRDDVEFEVWNKATQALTNRTLQAPQDKAGIPCVVYILDGVAVVLKNISAPTIGSGTVDYVGSDVFDCSMTLTDLSEGNHNLTIVTYGRQSAADLVTMGFSSGKDPEFIAEGIQYSKDVWSSVEIAFVTDAVLPKVSIISPNNSDACSAESIELSFTVNEPVTWTGYSIDGGVAVTCDGNITLPDLPNGSHSVVVYANDTAGNTAKSETLLFTVNAPAPTASLTPSPSPTPEQTSPTNQATSSPKPQQAVFPMAFIYLTIGTAAVVAVVALIVLLKKKT